MRTDTIIEIGNLLPPRDPFKSPQEGRVYLGDGLSPSMRNDSIYYVLMIYEN